MSGKAPRRAVVALCLVMVTVATVGSAATLVFDFPNGYTAENATYVTDSGVAVTVVGEYNASSGNPFTDTETLELETSRGNVTVSGSGAANVTIDQITGAETRLSDLEVATNAVTVDPEDKQSITVSGATESLAFRSMQLDDGAIDFSYAGASGTTTLTVRNLPTNTDILAREPGGNELDKATSDGSGTATFEMPNSEHDVELVSTTVNPPEFSNPDPTGTQSETPDELAVDVSDDDFPGDEVQVNISLDGTQQSSQNITSNQRVKTSIGSISPGQHEWTVTATDSFGNSETTTYTFGVPDELHIYNESTPGNLVDDRTVNATFFSGGEEVFSRTTSNGTIALEGLPSSENLVVVLRADGYYTRTAIIDDIAEQQRAYILPQNASAVEVRFQLDDPTGVFPSTDSELYVKRPLDINGTTKFQTITADEFGVEGFTTDLEQDVRYRLVLKNDRGDVRTLGAYTASVAETVTLQPTTLEMNYTEGQGYAWNFAYRNETGNPTLVYEFSDPEQSTRNLEITIHERGNESNVFPGYPVEHDGPLGNISISEPLTAEQNNKTWVVKWTAQRNGKRIDSQLGAGDNTIQLPMLSSWWRQAFAFAILLITGGLFSRANVGVGAMTVALVAGVFWWMGWLGMAATGASIVVGIGLAALVWANESRGV